MKTMHLMGLNFGYKASFNGYEYIIIDRVWNGIGTMNFSINADVTNSELIAIDDIVWLDKDYDNAFIIERIEEVLEGSNITYNVTALGLNSLLSDYLTIPELPNVLVEGKRHEIARLLVDSNAINPYDESREQYNIVLGNYEESGETTDVTRRAKVSENLSRVLAPDGWNLRLDIPNQQIVFDVLKGVDRTSEQTENGRVLFGVKYGNLTTYRKVIDASSEKTVAYGGVDLVKAGNPTGRKKEVFVSGDEAITELLNQELIKNQRVDTFDFEAIAKQYEYKVDYDLGDYVTVVSDTISHRQITKIKEIYERGNVKILPEIGVPEKSIADIFGGYKTKLELVDATQDTIDCGGVGETILGIDCNIISDAYYLLDGGEVVGL